MQLKEISLANFTQEQRIDLYSAVLIEKGKGVFHINSGSYEFSGPSLIFISPFQTLSFTGDGKKQVPLLQFHGDFYCIEFHKPEVACNGLLFNNVYLSPVLPLTEKQYKEIQGLLKTIAAELKAKTPDRSVQISYLQLFLALTSRMKRANIDITLPANRDELMEKFKEHIDQHFLTKHNPAQYADLLSVTANTLSKKSKKYFGKTPSELIRERLVLEAQKHLHLTRKSVKEIAFALNFEDEHYFSRFFKKAVGLSPQMFRSKAGISIVADLSNRRTV